MVSRHSLLCCFLLCRQQLRALFVSFLFFVMFVFSSALGVRRCAVLRVRLVCGVLRLFSFALLQADCVRVRCSSQVCKYSSSAHQCTIAKNACNMTVRCSGVSYLTLRVGKSAGTAAVVAQFPLPLPPRCPP